MKSLHCFALAFLALFAPAVLAQSAVVADTVLRGGKIVTLDKRSSIPQAVAIRDGRFLAVGSNDDVARLVGPTTKIIDLGGRTVVPGLMDSHTHFRAAGLALYTVNMRSATSVQQALDA